MSKIVRGATLSLWATVPVAALVFLSNLLRDVSRDWLVIALFIALMLGLAALAGAVGWMLRRLSRGILQLPDSLLWAVLAAMLFAGFNADMAHRFYADRLQPTLWLVGFAFVTAAGLTGAGIGGLRESSRSKRMLGVALLIA